MLFDKHFCVLRKNPQMPRRTKEQAQQTRESILWLWGALNVFSEKGFSRSTLADAAKHIGMTRGAVYWHFKNKRELLVELIEAMHEREDEFLTDRVPSIRSLDDLLAHFMARVELVESDKDLEFRKFIHFMSMQVEWATEKQIFLRLREDHLRCALFHKVIKALTFAQEQGEIRSDVDLEQTCDILVGLLTGMVRHSLSGLAKTPLSDGLKSAIQAVFDSIRA